MVEPDEEDLPLPDVEPSKVQELIKGGTDAEITRLKEAARERWGEAWTIQTLRFADGSTRSYAYRSCGRTDDGYLERERLFPGADGEIYHDRVMLDPKRLVETIKSDYSPQEEM